MATADDLASGMSDDLLRQAIEIGENMIRIADAVGQPVAGNYFSIGLELLRDAAQESSTMDDGVVTGVPDGDMLEIIPLQPPAR